MRHYVAEFIEHQGQMRCTGCGDVFLPRMLAWKEHHCTGWQPLSEEGLFPWAGWAHTVAQAAKDTLGLSPIETYLYLDSLRDRR